MTDTSKDLIYISYRWRGAKDLIDQFAKDLKAALQSHRNRTEVFQDSASLHPGESWPAQLQHALARAKILIVVIDRDWVRHADDYGRRRIDDDEDWVRLEIERSLNRGITVIPVLIDDAEMPPAQALPEKITGLTQFPAMRLRKTKYQSDLDELIRRINEFLDESIPTAVPTRAGTGKLPLQILDLEISNFRCFEALHIDFSVPSALPGEWTCVAGINGAGKSTVLQALALLLMGPEHARELGGRRLQSLRRRDASGPELAHLKTRVRHLGEEFSLEMTIDERGPQAYDHSFWSYAPELLIAGYGASRNLSETPDRYDELSPLVRACISLFDPMARLQRAEAILGDGESSRAAQKLFVQLIESLFREEVQVSEGDPRPSFSNGGARVSALELPDGFRSSVAWLVDICDRWAGINSRKSLVSEMTGIVLIDEIDLHLHASLQRAIIPRLRAALPNMQFVVTSHSPLILTSFDQNELIMLDNEEEDGVRVLDRQILGFSPDQVYEWLLGTPASSEAIEDFIDAAREKPEQRLQQLSDVLGVSPDMDSSGVKERAARIRDRIRKLKR